MMETEDAPALISLADYMRAAERAMDPGTLAYVLGGAGDEVTLRDNVDSWRRLAIHPRVLVDVGRRDPTVTLLGRSLPHPIVIAPMAFQRLAHPDGEVATAKAAAATGTTMCLSTLATASAADLARAVPDARRWFQLYVFADRGVSRELVAQAVEHGFEALVVTVDVPALGVREREARSRAAFPAELVAGAAAAGASGLLMPADFVALIDATLTWADLEQFAAESPLPLVVKGILTPTDAVLAADHGAAAIVVSNHGGRQLDTVIAGADALAPVLDAVGDRLEVLVDGGIRRGTDVLKALALGARAVLVGRPVLCGLAVDGAAGVQRVLELLLAEFDVAMALAGARTVAELNRSFVSPAPWARQPDG